VVENSRQDDYHPSASDLIKENAGDKIAEKVWQNHKVRLETKAREAAALAGMEGVVVCVADSRRAGNCEAGTFSFATRHNLDPRQHYPAAELVQIANGDSSRVRLAITAAVLRHKREMERGYSELAEHGR
jgi:hypothetical protein